MVKVERLEVRDDDFFCCPEELADGTLAEITEAKEVNSIAIGSIVIKLQQRLYVVICGPDDNEGDTPFTAYWSLESKAIKRVRVLRPEEKFVISN